MKKQLANPSREMFSSRIELADVDVETQTFSGLAVRFDTVLDHMWYPTLFERGSFSRTLSDNAEKTRVVLLQQHDPGIVLGKPTRLYESDRGLEIEGKISETQAGRDMVILMRDGVVDEMSIGIDPVKWVMEQNSSLLGGRDTLRRMQDSTLREISLCVFAVDPGAKVEEVNSVNGSGLSVVAGEWDPIAAESRVRAWATEDGEMNPDKYSEAFLWSHGTDCRMQVADVVDGELVAIDRAVFAAGSLLSTSQTHKLFSPHEIGAIQRHVGHYYHALSRSAPWERQPNILLNVLEPVLALPVPDLGGETFEVLSIEYKKEIQVAVETLSNLIEDEGESEGTAEGTDSDDGEGNDEPDDFDPDGEIAGASLALADLEQGD